MKTKRTIASVLLAMAAATMLIAGNGPAGATEPAQSSSVMSDVFGVSLEAFLADYPEARPLDDGSYQLEPGLRLTPPGWAPEGGARVAALPSNCEANHFCLYQHSNFGGWAIQRYECGEVMLGSRANAASSLYNAQNGFSAYFWDTGPEPDVRGALGPNRYLRNLAQDTAPDGDSWNDRIDKYKAC